MDEKKDLSLVNVRLVKDKKLTAGKAITSYHDAVELIADELTQHDREAFCVINLTTKGKVINASVVSVGTLDTSVISPREIFKCSILSNASAVILMHNHPSGEVSPSQEDILTTERLIRCGKLLGIEVVDHIIVGENENFLSMRAADYFGIENDARFSDFLEKCTQEPEEESGIKISRVIDGIPMEFELTEDELFRAYKEQELKWDIDFVMDSMDSNYAPNSLYGMDTEDITSNDFLVEILAKEMREIVDKTCKDNLDALQDACSSIIPKYLSFTEKDHFSLPEQKQTVKGKHSFMGMVAADAYL